MGKAACRFVIEEALASDILAIYEIGRICFSDAWRKETVDHDFQGTHSHYLVARTSEKVIGYACFWYVLDEAQLVNIGVLPEFRKQGAAKAILVAGFVKSLEKALKSMFLEFRVINHGAKYLYNNFGFHVDGLRKSVYELPVEDGYIMSRKL